MIPETEGFHVWSVDALRLNDEATLTTLGYWFKLDSIPGLKTLGDTDLNAEPATGHEGEITRRTLRRGKSVSYEGRVMAQTLPNVRAGVRALERAFQDAAVGEMALSLHGDYNPPGKTTYVYGARCSACAPADKDVLLPGDHYPYQRPFVVGLRVHDPRFYENVWREAVLSSLYGSGATWPMTYPMTISGDLPHQVNVAYAGTAPGEPIIELVGPWLAPHARHEGMGAQVAFPGLALNAGQTLVIDFAKRSATIGGADVRGYRDRAVSDWWDASVPGLPANVASVVTLGGRAGSRVRWRDAHRG